MPTEPPAPAPAVDVETLERATVMAVSPQQVVELPGWLLPMDSGTVGRARSAVPLSHRRPDHAILSQVLQAYAEAAQVPRWRLPDTPAFAELRQALSEHGFERRQPTLTQVADLRQAPWAAQRAAAAPPTPVPWRLSLQTQASPGWLALYLGADFDPVDGASRAQALARSPHTQYASASVQGEVVACGAVSLSHGWMGVHGMRTQQAWRGQGLAKSLLQLMAQQAQNLGLHQAFLQVDEGNTAAQKAYAPFGFVTAWRYAYWVPKAGQTAVAG